MLLLAKTRKKKKDVMLFSTPKLYYTYKQHIFDKQNIQNNTVAHPHINLLKSAWNNSSGHYHLYSPNSPTPAML